MGAAPLSPSPAIAFAFASSKRAIASAAPSAVISERILFATLIPMARLAVALQIPLRRIKQLAELAIKTTGSKSKIVYLPLPGDDPKQRKPDITKARKYLGWEPKIKLEVGIVKAAEYFRSLDLGRIRKPTQHTAHKNTEVVEQAAKKQKTG